MPDKITSLNNISVGVSAVILLAISYLMYMLKSMQEDKNKDIKNIQDEIKHQREMHDHHYNFEKQTIAETSEIKTELKNIVKDFDRLQSAHDENHRGNK